MLYVCVCVCCGGNFSAQLTSEANQPETGSGNVNQSHESMTQILTNMTDSLRLCSLIMILRVHSRKTDLIIHIAFHYWYLITFHLLILQGMIYLRILHMSL